MRVRAVLAGREGGARAEEREGPDPPRELRQKLTIVMHLRSEARKEKNTS